MGDIAEMIVDGDLCQECGVFIEDEPSPGHPRSCADCERDAQRADARKRRPRRGRRKH